MRVKGIKNKLAVFVSVIVLAAGIFSVSCASVFAEEKVRKKMIRPTVGGSKMENR